ncbi:MAG: YggS family pyridoxal phosphate-dependent enzyme [Syntrophomonadaceae bacterium]|nr:YggS family pyridoxal phosphate-dependent enzyme [Syntrophomonadaceae bacterium]
MKQLRENIQKVRQRIERAALRSGRNGSDILLVAVSKTADIAQVHEAYQLGIKHFGENRVQELKRKMEALPEAEWHMIGRLQTNKVKDIVGKVTLLHSLDRWKLAEKLNERAAVQGVTVPALLQVNIAGEEKKAGVEMSDVEAFLSAVGELSALRIYGLMTIAPLLEDAEAARPIFRELYQVKEKLARKSYKNVELKFLSMGMSQDFEVAIEEGANIVRIGSAIFDQKDSPMY